MGKTPPAQNSNLTKLPLNLPKRSKQMDSPQKNTQNKKLFFFFFLSCFGLPLPQKTTNTLRFASLRISKSTEAQLRSIPEHCAVASPSPYVVTGAASSSGSSKRSSRGKSEVLWMAKWQVLGFFYIEPRNWTLKRSVRFKYSPGDFNFPSSTNPGTETPRGPKDSETELPFPLPELAEATLLLALEPTADVCEAHLKCLWMEKV